MCAAKSLASCAAERAGRSYGGESAGERDDRRKRQLLDAGFRCFGTDGFRATTVRGLCADAHVAYRNFYDYFDSLEDVLLEVYRECNERLMGAVVAAVGPIEEGMKIADAAARGMDAYFSVVEDRQLARIVWFEVLGVSDRVDQAYRDLLGAFALYLETLVESWRPGSSTPIRRQLLSVTVVGGLSHLAVVWTLDDYDQDRSEVATAGRQLILSIASGIGQ